MTVAITNILWAEYDSGASASIDHLKQAAVEFNLIPLGEVAEYGDWFALACTNESAGKCLEIANYLVETTDYFAFPLFVSDIVVEF